LFCRMPDQIRTASSNRTVFNNPERMNIIAKVFSAVFEMRENILKRSCSSIIGLGKSVRRERCLVSFQNLMEK